MTVIGSAARGNWSARIRPRLPVIALVPFDTAVWVNMKMNTPVHRYAMKFGTFRFCDRITPKIRK